jgi:DNA-binding MarR family transcriptional regulator
MKLDPDTYQDLFEEIRHLHNRLRWLGDQVHVKAGQTSAKRSLLMSLHREGPTPVPDLARERLVSRQIVQTQINLLTKDGLVTAKTNPRHKRSKQIVLTHKGKALVERMLQREADLLRQAEIPISESELNETIERLQRVRKRLENHHIQL